MRRSRAEGDRGSIALELAVVFPVLIMFLFFVVGFGRLFGSRSDVAGAAQAGARAAATARSQGEAQSRATNAVAAALSGSDTCSNFNTEMSGFLERGGQVTVRVTCAVDLADLAGFDLFVDVDHQVWAEATATVDQYRVLD